MSDKISVDPEMFHFCSVCGPGVDENQRDVWIVRLDLGSHIIKIPMCHEHRAHLYGELAPSL